MTALKAKARARTSRNCFAGHEISGGAGCAVSVRLMPDVTQDAYDRITSPCKNESSDTANMIHGAPFKPAAISDSVSAPSTISHPQNDVAKPHHSRRRRFRRAGSDARRPA
ncbi:MAG TPA: hypothetical protein VD995_33970, partial [Azospirillum sp.]|nr:hypothetical protein [Azospirillum sp.]